MRVLVTEIAPEGMLRSAAIFGVYPKFLIRVAEYVVTTPEDILGYVVLAP
jgi:hypothetical protein